MTDLTEQWKKGELPEGYYYVRDGENMIAEYLDGYFYNNGEPMTSFTGGVDEVLAPVPSYDEWKASYNCMLENEVLRLKNSQLKEQINKCCLDAINRGTANAVKAVKEFGMPERIERLEKQYDRAKWWLNEIVKNHRYTPISTAEKALKDLKESEKNDTQNKIWHRNQYR